MIDILMQASGIVLLILFVFLAATNLIIMVSWFKKREYPGFTPGISLIIPVFNNPEAVKCIDAALKSNYPSMEIIVIDDGSTDSTLKALKKYSGSKKVKVFSQKKGGKTAAVNFGIKKAKHEYIVTIDDDTLLEKGTLRSLVAPLQRKDVAASSGTYRIRTEKSLLGSFQKIEYAYNNLIRKGFSEVFGNGIWFYGAIACYKKSVLKEIGYFHKTYTEDLDILLRMQKQGYLTVHASEAYASTDVPLSLKSFIKQRTRWWAGVVQAMIKHNSSIKNNPSIPLAFVYLSQMWWVLFAMLSIPIFIMQILYWMPASTSEMLGYIFRWFSLSGPIYVIYKIPVWGISIYSIFGVLAGLLTAIFLIISLYVFREKIGFSELVAIFFYFPYTIILNVAIIMGVFKYLFDRKGFFIRN